MNHYSRFYSYSIIFFFIFLLFSLAFFSMRGLDITDDSSYVLAARYPQDVLASVSSFPYIIGALFKAFYYDVLKLRWFCVASVGFSAALIGWQAWIKNPILVRLGCAAFTGLGGLLYFVRGGLFTPSYNTLVSVIINLSAALYISYCNSVFEFSGSTRKNKILLLIQGLLIGICILSKLPSGVALLCFWMINILILNRRINWLHQFFFIFAGLGLTFLLYFISIQEFHSWRVMISNGLYSSTHFIHVPKNLFLQYGQDILFSCFVLLSRFLVLFSMLLLTIWFQWSRISLGIILTLIFLSFISYGYHMGGQEHIFVIFQFYLFLMILSLALIVLYIIKFIKVQNIFIENQRQKNAIILIGLGVLPFIGMAGTNNPLSVNILMNLGPWFGCYTIIFLTVLKKFSIAAWSGTILLVVGFFAVSQVMSAAVFSPYRLHTGILKQDTSINLGEPPTQLLLDGPTAEFFSKMKNVASGCGFKSGGDILAFLDMPGIVWALGGRSPGTTWWLSHPYTGLSPKVYSIYNNFVLRLVPAQRVKSAYILERVNVFTVIPNTKLKGISFPEDYSLCGEATWPLDGDKIRLWKPKI